MIGVGGVERPRVLRPRPPHQPEDEQRRTGRARIDMAVQQRHDLRDAEHEHQIEEQLDEGDALIVR